MTSHNLSLRENLEMGVGGGVEESENVFKFGGLGDGMGGI